MMGILKHGKDFGFPYHVQGPCRQMLGTWKFKDKLLAVWFWEE